MKEDTKKTVEDVLAEPNDYQERVQAFAAKLQELTTEFDINPQAALSVTQGGIVPVINLVDIRGKNTETPEAETDSQAEASS